MARSFTSALARNMMIASLVLSAILVAILIVIGLIRLYPIAAFGVSPCRSEPAPILCDVSNAMVSIAGECSVLQTGRESWTHVQYFERSTARAPTIMIEHGRSNKSSASSDEGPPCAAIGVKRSAAERLVPSDGVDGMRRTSSEEKISAGIPGEGRGGGSNKG